MTIRCQVEIKNRLGLHARPAMKLFELIQTFRSTVVFRNKQNEEARRQCARHADAGFRTGQFY